MADDKGTVGDKGGPGKCPIEHAEVIVDVTPGSGGNRNATDKIEENLERAVRDAIDQNAEGGRDKQLEAVDAVVDEAAGQIDPSTADTIDVTVYGDAGEEEFIHEKNISRSDPDEADDIDVDDDGSG